MFYKNHRNLISHELYEKSFILKNEKYIIFHVYYQKRNIINRYKI